MEFFYTQENRWSCDDKIDEYFNHKLNLFLNLT